jgi:uncharacterized protein YcbK (DUF882 family)
MNRLPSTYFKRKEFACKCGCGQNVVDAELLKVLDDLRSHFDNLVIIKSGNRCIKYNKKVGGAKKSKHIKGIAADIRVKYIFPKQVYKYLNEKYSKKYGLGIYKTWVHIDVRTNKARWNKV